jgi:hypothetical protein
MDISSPIRDISSPKVPVKVPTTVSLHVVYGPVEQSEHT